MRQNWILVESMAHSYWPIFIFLVMASLISGGAIVAAKIMARLLKHPIPDSEKGSAYECGFPAFEQACSRFDVKFYLVAILFIVFDLEVAFLFPFAVAMRHLHSPAFIAMAVFMLFLGLGFVYEWKKGALEWE